MSLNPSIRACSARLIQRHRTRLLLPTLLLPLLSGCSARNWVETLRLDSFVTFFTAGPVAAYERNLMLFTLGVLIFVLVPVVCFTLWFAWQYRASNRENAYTPNWHQSRVLEVFLWGGPVVIILILATLTAVTTADVDPYKPIESDKPPIQIEAIAMDWKWLFIYPDYDLAVVNEMAMPVDTPVSIRLTSATVMNAFMIPRLGSQIYAMSGMQTQLNLMASEEGRFYGKNYQYSGDGFADMNFDVKSMSQQAFDQWLDHARSANKKLDISAYQNLLEPSRNDVVSYFSSVRPDLFQHVIEAFNSDGGNPYQVEHKASASH